MGTHYRRLRQPLQALRQQECRALGVLWCRARETIRVDTRRRRLLCLVLSLRNSASVRSRAIARDCAADATSLLEHVLRHPRRDGGWR